VGNRVAKLLALARGAHELEEHEAALLLFQRVRDLDGKNQEALTAIAEIAAALGNADEAIGARLDLAEVYILTQQLELAAEMTDRILSLEPSQPMALEYRSFLARRLHPEADLGAGSFADGSFEENTRTTIASSPLTAKAAPVPVPVPVPVPEPADDDDDDGDFDDDDDGDFDDDDEWEARATAVIAAGNLSELLSAAEASVRDQRDDAGDDFAAPPRTIALGGQSATIAFAALLPKSPLLRALDSASAARLLDESEVQQCFAGQEIYEQGGGGSTLFLLLDGEGVMERSGRQVEALAPGSSFGEAALLAETPRLATVRVTGDALVLEINRALVQQISATQPALLRVLAHYVRSRAIAIQLVESPVFSRLPAPVLDEIAPLLHLHRIRRGQEVARRGQVPSGYWEVLVGVLESVDGRGFAGSDLGPGSSFGRSSLRDEPSPVTLTAISPCWLLELPIADVRDMLERFPELAGPLAQ
jgi:CRP-like cAMP-binding protein